MDISLAPSDQVLLAGQPVDPRQALAPHPEVLLSVRRASTLRLSSGSPAELRTTAATLGQALWEEGIALRLGDRISASLTAPVSALAAGGDPPEISLQVSRPVSIQTAAGEIRLHTSALTVGEALAEAGLALQGLDYSQPASEEAIPAGGEIRLVRVLERVIVEQTLLEFETDYQPDPNTPIDTQKIIQTGEYGLTATRMRIRYEDGQEIARQEEAQWVSRPPVNRVVGYGTALVKRTVTTSDGATIEIWRELQMYATSYRPRETSNTTASGLPLKKGVAAIDTNYIAFGTRMYVPGYGEALAADRGGGVKGRWIDLGYSNEDYVNWHWWVTVYFLWPPPPPESIVWVIP
jgi:uncharacterized protein YabE (DUF348 family)